MAWLKRRNACDCAGALLRAFPPVMEGESLTHRQARMLAGQAAWSMFCQQAQVCPHVEWRSPWAAVAVLAQVLCTCICERVVF